MSLRKSPNPLISVKTKRPPLPYREVRDMKSSIRKVIALTVAGMMVATSVGFTAGNVLKAVNEESANQVIEQPENNNPEENASTEEPEVIQEEIANRQEAPAPVEHTLTIHYYGVDGLCYRNDYVGSFLEGADYSITSPNVPGFNADKPVVSGTMGSEDVEIYVSYTYNGDSGITYLYGLIPGVNANANISNDRKWLGLGTQKIYGVFPANKYNMNQQISGATFGEGVKAIFPDITINGKTYKYAAQGSAQASQYGYYTAQYMNTLVASGANSGSNSYNPYVNAGIKTFHTNYQIMINSEEFYSVNFLLANPGSSKFTYLGGFAQRADAGSSESKIVLPDSASAPSEAKNGSKEYVFDGWYRDEQCTQKAEFNGLVDSNRNFYGRYIEKTKQNAAYTVEHYGYDGNGGWTKLDSETLEGKIGTEVTAESKVFAGYTFYEGYSENLSKAYVIGDGSLTLKFFYKVNAEVSITGSKLETKYSGETQSLEGYTLEAKTEVDGVSYDTANTVLKTKAVIAASGKDAGTYDMGLAADQFANIDDGFNVSYVLASDGQLTIGKRDVVIASESASKPFDRTALRADSVKISGDGFVQGEGFGYLFDEEYVKQGTYDNHFIIVDLPQLATNYDNYNITIEYGKIAITAPVATAAEPAAALQAPERTVVAAVANADGDYTLTSITNAETPLAKIIDLDCCILHFIIIFIALCILVYYTVDTRRRKRRIFKLEESIAEKEANA